MAQNKNGNPLEKNSRNNSFRAMVQSLMSNAEGILTSKTVVGAPVDVGGQVIIPLSDVSIGCGAGSNTAGARDNGMGGFSAKMSPTAVLVIKDGMTKVVNIRDSNTLLKVMDMVPEVIDKFKGEKAGMASNEAAIDAAFPDMADDAEDAPEI